MKKLLYKFFRKVEKYLPAFIVCRLEFKNQTFNNFNERPIEFGFVFKCITKLYPNTILDVGTGTTALPHLIRNCGPLVTAIDNVTDYWPKGMSNRHYHVLDKDITSSTCTINSEFDMITCISVLEHIIQNHQAMKNMFGLLKVGGHIVLTCPYTEKKYESNVYKLPDSNAYHSNIPFVCQSYSRSELNDWIKEFNGEIIEQQYWQFWDGKFWSAGNRIIPPVMTESDQPHQLSCVLIKKIK